MHPNVVMDKCFATALCNFPQSVLPIAIWFDQNKVRLYISALHSAVLGEVVR
uniref:Uncharacterized protein n=1 Tax=Anguilla anguilla TaxID=7936 RepID=A0A0E9WPN2_ANGAN